MGVAAARSLGGLRGSGPLSIQSYTAEEKTHPMGHQLPQIRDKSRNSPSTI